MTRTARVPAVIEEALWAAARARLPASVLSGATLTAAVVERSRRYTTERDDLRGPTRGHAAAADLAARALFFTVADAGKLPLVLDELTAAPHYPEGLSTNPPPSGQAPMGPPPDTRNSRAPIGFLAGERLAVLDVGAGCGAMTLGLIVHLAERGWGGELTLTLVDHDSDALAIGAAAIAQVAAALGVRCAISARDLDVTAGLPRGPFDLIVAGTIVNELTAGTALVTAMMAALAPRGVAIVIEPALRVTTRGLHAVRDALITAGTAAVLAPCVRRAAPCPALADERDWCHDHRPAELPPRTRQLATVTGLRDGEAKLAFLALARPEDAPPPIAAWRVVDDPHGQKGKLELTACGEPGWVAVRLLRRHRSAANRAIERVRRGDLFTVPCAADAGALELGPDDRVTAEP